MIYSRKKQILGAGFDGHIHTPRFASRSSTGVFELLCGCQPAPVIRRTPPPAKPQYGAQIGTRGEVRERVWRPGLRASLARAMIEALSGAPSAHAAAREDLEASSMRRRKGRQ